MYNRILNRPMFKLGGDTVNAQGTGITSGLDVPRQRYQKNGFVKSIDERIANLKVDPQDYRQATWEGVAAGFGDPSTKTLSEAVWKANMARQSGIKPLEAGLEKQRSLLEGLKITMPYERETALMVEEAKKRKLDVQYRIERLNVMGAKRRKSLNEALNQAEGLDEMAEIRKQIQDLDSFLIKVETEILRKGKPAGQTIRELTAAIIKAGIITDPQKALEQAAVIYEASKAVAGEVDLQATGGRVGYQFGTGMQGAQPTEVGLNVDETVQTPQGTVQEDVSVQEKIQPSVNMTYQEFRAKMPPQVDDEIVQLIYYNQDAFADFAQIKTQDEVYAFNNKWGVSLVLPFDTEIT